MKDGDHGKGDNVQAEETSVSSDGPLSEAGEALSSTARSRVPVSGLTESLSHATGKRTLRLPSGYAIESSPAAQHEVLTITAPNGCMCFKIDLLPEGPLVHLHGVSLNISTDERLHVNCKQMEIDAEEQIVLRAGGSLACVAGGDLRLQAEGAIESEGFSQRLSARRGNIDVNANDDVQIDGERIRLNSPRVTEG